MTSTHFIEIVTSRRPCWWSRQQMDKTINFFPLGTKLYFHVNSSRKIYIVLTFNKAAFSRGCKPRITSYLISGSLLQCPRRHTPGICSSVCAWWSTHHPRACRKSQFPIPELQIKLIYVFWEYIFSRAKFFKIVVLCLITHA